jgi:hypothetical protein
MPFCFLSHQNTLKSYNIQSFDLDHTINKHERDHHILHLDTNSGFIAFAHNKNVDVNIIGHVAFLE